MKLQTIGACAAVLEAKGLLKNRVTEETAKRAVLQLSCYSREVREGTLFLCKGAAFHEKYLGAVRGRVCGAPLPMSANRNILRAARYRVCWSRISVCDGGLWRKLFMIIRPTVSGSSG